MLAYSADFEAVFGQCWIGWVEFQLKVMLAFFGCFLDAIQFSFNTSKTGNIADFNILTCYMGWISQQMFYTMTYLLVTVTCIAVGTEAIQIWVVSRMSSLARYSV